MIRKVLLSLFTFFCCSLSLATYFDGHIYDQDTLLPIPGAVVTAGGIIIDEVYTDTTWVDTTDVNGYYYLDDLIPTDDYTINASALGYESVDELMEEPPGTYDFYLWKPDSGVLVETINEGLKNYDHNGEYWYRTNGAIDDNSNENFFFDIDAQSDTIIAFMNEIGAGMDYTDDDQEIYQKFQTVWNWMGENCYFNYGDSLWQEAVDYLMDQSGDHYYTIAAIADTDFEYGFLPWGTCMSKSNMMATILYKTGIDMNRFFIGECRWHRRYSQHMYIIINLFDHWYHFDPGLYEDDIPVSENLHSIPNYISGYRDFTHPWNMFIFPNSTLTDLPVTTYKTRNEILYLESPPEKTHTLIPEIEISGLADSSSITNVIIQDNLYPVISDHFIAVVTLAAGENIITVSSSDRQYTDSVTIFKVFYGITDFNSDITEGSPPLEVQFSDASIIPDYYEIDSWEWDFDNDGIIDSYVQNPSYVYADTGNFTVSLTLTVEVVEDVFTKADYINVFNNKLSGNVYLEGESDHSGIIVDLYRGEDSLHVRSKVTAADGYYEFYLDIGNYFLKYSRENYFPRFSPVFSFTSDLTLADVFLIPQASLILVPDYLPTITAAIDFAMNGDTIRIAPGIYMENIDFIGKNLLLESYYPSTQDTNFISGTVIQGTRGGSVISIMNDESFVRLDGFTVTGGNAEFGGGIRIEYLYSEAQVILNNLRIINNSADYGGGIYCRYSPLEAENIQLEFNIANYGGGMYLKNSYLNELNQIYCYENSAVENGGGIFCNSCNDPVYATGLKMIANSAGFSGGALHIEYTDIKIIRATLKDNSAIRAGAIYTTNSDLNINNSLFQENIASYSRNNGGACYLYFTEALLVNNNFIANSASFGAAIIGHGTSSIEIYNCIFSQNNDGSTIKLWHVNTDLIAAYNLFWDEGDIFADCNDSLGILVDTNINGDSCDAFYNIYLDPLFIDMSEQDFHLEDNSPCINAGIADTTGLNLPLIDFEGNPRIVNSIVDMGMIEYNPDGYFSSPVNVVIQCVNDSLKISWDPVTSASSYKVYASDNPNTGFIYEPDGIFSYSGDRIIWEKCLIGGAPKRFYQIRALSE
ncbi:MAG: hypothetical protein KAT74_04660 [Candidatus Cloacimonetes bacterium]|nr:hypothetical protein [Candidatus Cloacimonadota bacterium]